MKLLVIVFSCVLLLGLGAFSVFGFLATFEPTGNPLLIWLLRSIYVLLGISCIGGIGAAVVHGFRT